MRILVVRAAIFLGSSGVFGVESVGDAIVVVGVDDGLTLGFGILVCFGVGRSVLSFVCFNPEKVASALTGFSSESTKALTCTKMSPETREVGNCGCEFKETQPDASELCSISGRFRQAWPRKSK